MTIMTPAPLEQENDEMLVPHQELPAAEADTAQPMEVVAQTEAVSTAESQPPEDPQTSRFTWTIANFTRLNGKKHYSDVFVVGGFKWRVLIFPKGNNVEHLSMYLDVADSANLPYGWSRSAQFSLAIVNQVDQKYTTRKDTQHQFSARESDWGFTSFMPLSELYDPSRGYLVNDTVVVEAEVAVRKMVAAPSAPQSSFMGDARGSSRQAAPSASSGASHVRKLSWFQRHVLCMNIDIRKEQFEAYRERHVIRSRLPSLPDDPPVTAPLSYERWNSKSKTPWVQLEKDLLATDPDAPAASSSTGPKSRTADDGEDEEEDTAEEDEDEEDEDEEEEAESESEFEDSE